MKSGLRLFPGALTVVHIVAKIAMRTERSNRYQQDEQRLEEQNSEMEAFRGRLNGGGNLHGNPDFIPASEVDKRFEGETFKPVNKAQVDNKVLVFDSKGNVQAQGLVISVEKGKARIRCKDPVTTKNYDTELTIDSIRGLKEGEAYTLKIQKGYCLN